jgi:hypothetical protein
MSARKIAPLVAILALAVASGCGGSSDSGNSSSGSNAEVPATLTDTGPAVKIAAADFAKWSDASGGAKGFECEHPRMIFSDTGEAVDHAGAEAKIKSKVTPTFQCIDADHTFWAIPRKDRADAEKNSDAEQVASNFNGVSVVTPPASAPKDSTCLEYNEGPKYSCFFPWRNLTLMATSTKSLDDAGAVLSGGLATVEAVYAK